MGSEMTQDILFENKQKYLDIPQFFAQVSNFDINC